MPAPIPAPEHEEIPTPTTTRQVTSRGRLVLSDLGFEADCDLVGQVEEGRFTLAHLLTIHLDSSAAGVDNVTQKETPALHAAMLPIRRGRGDDLDSATPDRSPPPIGRTLLERLCWCVRRWDGGANSPHLLCFYLAMKPDNDDDDAHDVDVGTAATQIDRHCRRRRC